MKPNRCQAQKNASFCVHLGSRLRPGKVRHRRAIPAHQTPPDGRQNGRLALGKQSTIYQQPRTREPRTSPHQGLLMIEQRSHLHHCDHIKAAAQKGAHAVHERAKVASSSSSKEGKTAARQSSGNPKQALACCLDATLHAFEVRHGCRRRPETYPFRGNGHNCNILGRGVLRQDGGRGVSTLGQHGPPPLVPLFAVLRRPIKALLTRAVAQNVAPAAALAALTPDGPHSAPHAVLSNPLDLLQLPGDAPRIIIRVRTRVELGHHLLARLGAGQQVDVREERPSLTLKYVAMCAAGRAAHAPCSNRRFQARSTDAAVSPSSEPTTVQRDERLVRAIKDEAAVSIRLRSRRPKSAHTHANSSTFASSVLSATTAACEDRPESYTEQQRD